MNNYNNRNNRNRKICTLIFIILILFMLSGCNSVRKANSSNLTYKLLNQSIKDGITDGYKKSKIVTSWESKVLDSEESGIDYYSYFEFSNRITLKIPNNKFFIEVYLGSKVNNPSPNEYYIDSYNSTHKLYYKEYSKNKFFYYLLLYDNKEIDPNIGEDKIETSYNLDWVTNKTIFDDKDLIEKYINIKLFENYYRLTLFDKVSIDNYYTFNYDDILDIRKKLTDGDFIFNLESFLFNSYLGEIRFYDWIESTDNKDIRNIRDSLINIVDIRENKKEIENYISNFDIVNGKPIFLNPNLFYKINYLDEELNLKKISLEMVQKIDAYNIFEGWIE